MKGNIYSNDANLKQYADHLEAEYSVIHSAPIDFCIIYISSSKGLFSQEQLTSILEKSQQKNRSLGVSGILLYFNGSIIQVLEGLEERVKDLYRVIQQDSRHTGLILMYSYPIAKRTFSDWSMGYKTLLASEYKQVRDQFQFVGDSALQVQKQDNVVLAILQRFYLNNYRN
ncbi:BLUF domain-containing protein [Spirosoma sp.]|uniref:BLUF domain-containing protein n=1 Tax=Spirosoma sp. TaxID=1899569 RepID=UPI00261BC373|nr:BLUF domain-containing protein [Spirosoma sp.]MCX6215821.1 BLUF domain-containing protein [Spirosoma sp.]